MGACNSTAALDPVEATGGAPPVFWSPEKEQEKRLAKLREIQAKQEAEIERATGHLRRGSGGGRRRTNSKPPVPSVNAEEKEKKEKKPEEEKEAAAVKEETTIIASPRPTPSIHIPSTTQPPLSSPNTPLSTAQSPPPSHRHQRSDSASPATSASSTPASSHRRVSTGTPRKGQWDYNDLPGARPALKGEGQRLSRAPSMDPVSEPREEKEADEMKKEVIKSVEVKKEVEEEVQSAEANQTFGVKLRKAVRSQSANPAVLVAA